MGIKYTEASYQKDFLPGFIMLYSCTNNPKVNQQILADGKTLGVLVNIHDEPIYASLFRQPFIKAENLRLL